jgi:poly(A) polymerase
MGRSTPSKPKASHADANDADDDGVPRDEPLPRYSVSDAPPALRPAPTRGRRSAERGAASEPHAHARRRPAESGAPVESGVPAEAGAPGWPDAPHEAGAPAESLAHPVHHGPGRHDVTLEESRIDPDVQKVVRRLVRSGHEAYLVGGCVRDLLLDHRPKDFDVATSARPEEVRELFRNSRIIGRRFRLVHVLFQAGKVIEVATFRRNPKEETDEPHLSASDELLIRSDNVFGEASDDALRRDFTINALFYDLERRQILDWVGGMEDVRRRVVHTIGDPETRFREDPVRILRALKFAGRLDLGITVDVYDAIVYCREALALAARPRLSEEILRLLRGGKARRTIYLAWETGVLDVLLPELAGLLYDDGAEEGPGHRVWRLLDYIDKRTAESGPLDDTVLWTLLLLEPLKEACDGARDRAAAVADFLEPLIERLAISRRYADGMRRIVAVLPRLTSGRAGRFARTEMFQLAIEVAAGELSSRGESTEVIDRLRPPPVPAGARRHAEPAPEHRPREGARERHEGGRGRR